MHEASFHEENCFITLTYSNDHLPNNSSLDKAHFQKFMKRLRKNFPGRTVRYYMCGEYGENLRRPHYHACLFGLDFQDKELIREKPTKLYKSKTLENIWTCKKAGTGGFCTVGEVTFETAAYVARYCTKKINGERAKEHYCDKETGEVIEPEYTTMSRASGIGKKFFDKYQTDIYPWDEVIISGKPLKPPRYYDNLYQIEDPIQYEALKEKRLEKAKRLESDNTPQRLKQREVCKLAQYNQLKRGYENDPSNI